MSMRVIILGVAILAAGGAGYLAMNMMGSNRPVEPARVVAPEPQIELDEVLVASQTLTTGTRVEGQLRWQRWPADAVSPDFITRSSRPEAIDELSESVVRATIAEGEPVRPIKLLGADQSFMSSILPSGKRAVATQIAADTSAGGFILPDDYVDVIMTSRDRNGGFTTETILNNIRVLAIDQTIREDEQGRLVQVGQTATLELTPRQAEIITVAQQMADRLTLALRSVQDVDPADARNAAEHLIGDGPGGTITLIKRGQRTVAGQ
ncbi:MULTISPECIES: Flp pilus assembly protein CpaB [unclassified Roseitalea]|uniref:Flp pilus assembly protein CpaB n=1 Tax=unclassified Roseitalea TaxID=2639107 RepID=UPI00273E4497|nr:MULTISPECIES: Flp pilus assembly protein CpaB [unclassified Roseitalea]